MVEFRCIGHDSRHVCRSVLVAPGGSFLCAALLFLKKTSLLDKKVKYNDRKE